MSDRLRAQDLCVVIPTRNRWEILQRTLEGLRGQTANGFETLVVVDGTDQEVPTLTGVRVVEKDQGGPGAARNYGAHATDRAVVLFLGDDMIPTPDLVARHIEKHSDHPEDETAVLGHVDWHPEVERGRVQRWMDRARAQFDFATIKGDDAGFGHFYSCNVSLKRSFFLDAGGFDETFTYYYEDLDCGWRLAQKGMRLLYEPKARTAHLHHYNLASLERRFGGVASGERLMAAKHPWFEPIFLSKIRTALEAQKPHALWPWLVDLVPAGMKELRRKAVNRSNIWYLRALANPFLAGWAAAEDLGELQEYLGERYDYSHLVSHQRGVDDEREAAADEETFYRTSHEYLYDLTVFAMSGTKAPYLADLRTLVPRGGRLLDYGCGIGADGLRLCADGYEVAFADFANPSTSFLRWRLERRGVQADVYDLDADDIPEGFDAAYSFDVIEHVDDPFDFLGQLERRSALVAVNFLEEDPDDTDLHKPLPIGKLLDHASRRGLLRYRRYHGRSHFVVYRSPGSPGVSRARSAMRRHTGSHLPGRRPWFPIPRA